ncbi:MAG: hypothetical protein ACE15C_19620 [Phycisphaerae bacterium]
MKKFIAVAFVLTGIIPAQELVSTGAEPSAGLAASKPSSQPASKPAQVTLTGSFVWKGRPRQTTDVKAVLTPTAADEWSVVYTFTWDRQAMTYTGRMKGSLTSGELIGEGAPANRARTFAFKGTARDGVINFAHCETTRNRIDQTGTGVWKRG